MKTNQSASLNRTFIRALLFMVCIFCYARFAFAVEPPETLHELEIRCGRASTLRPSNPSLTRPESDTNRWRFHLKEIAPRFVA